MPNFEFGNVSNPEEAQRLGEILCQCFNFPTKDWPFYRDRLGLESFRVLRQEGKIAAGLGIYQMGQWFGGQSVPMAGIAAVGVPPEYRGTGVAFELLSQTLKELYDSGVPVSSLYPATQRLYRKVGYEQAGTRCTWELPTQSIRMSERSMPVRSVESSQHEVFHELYRQQASRNNGNLDRNTAIWENAVQHPDNAVYAYIAGSESQPEGYIIFSPKQEVGSNLLTIWDWAAVTPAAQRRLWAFLADHRSQIDKVIWQGSTLDSRLFLLAEQTAKIRSLDIWFLRVVNVALALEKRGYPAAMVAELHLSVTDNLLPANNGNFVLKVSGGRGEVTKGGKGELQLDIRALAPLYTGLFTAYQLHANGQLEATENALSLATQIFAGSQPWMPDFF
ncbi:GNAT family N-acetyltransferase [Microcoleus sp. FACHB-672]|uniref:GNAT family N-acetyltransferase n=1 Tax=Microcoleus sp. FACHB-672 TaxID=2692825 RepID=UPI0018F0219B|nr:GNAT family N-acetyltransferase [Microcoleus sp. FACHB-672]